MSLDQLGDLISAQSNVVTNNQTTIDLMKSDMNLDLPRFSGTKLPTLKTTKQVFLTGM